MSSPTDPSDAPRGRDFIRTIMDADLASGKHRGILTRFPPEPNGYLHIGHAKSICVNFGLAREYGGQCNLRFDDTNPVKEDQEYVDAIQRDVEWLGFRWQGEPLFASDYFEQLYAWAEQLITQGDAFVCSQTLDEVRATRGSVSEPGTASPDRDRPVAESLDLFRRMRAGEFADGALTLRAKIDMAHPNMKLRDPPMYRIRHAHHHRTGDAWCIYPMYDWAHGQSDAIEGITHSLCTLEFEVNRELYDWYLDRIFGPGTRPGAIPHKPRQIEFARLTLGYTVVSKRWLRQLVEDGHVAGWDDPRMPTLAALRRRGIRPSAVRAFAERVGLARADNVVDPAMLDATIRDDLNHEAPRVMAVLDPLEVVVQSWDDGHVEMLSADYWPKDVPKEGVRSVPFTRRLFIERDDFAVDPPKGFFRLSPGAEVRLRYGYLVTCTGYETDDAGRVTRVTVTHDPASRGGDTPDGRKVKGTLHWVSATHSGTAEVRLYDRLFSAESPGATGNFIGDLNPASLKVVTARVEPALVSAQPGTHWQFERQGYFFVDPVDSRPDALVFNRVVALKDAWARATAAPEACVRKAAPAAEAPRPNRERTPEEDALMALGVEAGEAEVLAADPDAAALFSATAGDRATVARIVVHEVRPHLAKGAAFAAGDLAIVAKLLTDGVIAHAGVKQVLAVMAERGGDAVTIVDELNLRVLRDTDVLVAAIGEVIAQHPSEVDRYRGGNRRLIGFFVGKVMRATGGAADPKIVTELLERHLTGAP